MYGTPGQHLCCDARKFFAEERTTAERGIQAQHAHLLFDFRIPANDRRAGMARQPRQLGVRFGAHGVAKTGILERIIHVREHHVLPDQQAEFIAEAMKVFAFVNRRARQANQIEAAVAKQLQTLAEDSRVMRSSDSDIGRSPDHAAAKNGSSVDLRKSADARRRIAMERNPTGTSSSVTVDPSASCNSTRSGYKARLAHEYAATREARSECATNARP